MFTFSQFWTLIITTSITATINGIVYVFVTRSVISAIEKEKKEVTKNDSH
jgi:hypothetical protein